jgi:4-amino-4-deoxy-L-arabinose transferase-like glycosyltransferase
LNLYRKGARFFKRAQPRHWILAVILIAGGLLRFSGLDQESLWADEYHSLLNAMQPTWRAVSQHAWLQGVQPPYFWLLHGFIQLVSPSDVALRIPSAVCGVMAIFFLYQLGRLLIATRPGFALMGAALLALSPMHIWYSQEARPYALSQQQGRPNLAAARKRSLRAD